MNSFAIEYFLNKDRDPSDLERAIVKALDKELNACSWLNSEICSVKLPDGNSDVMAACAVVDRLLAQMDVAKLSIESVMTVLERRNALLAKKKNFEPEAIPTFLISANDDGDEALVAVGISGGDTALTDAINGVLNKKVVAGMATCAVSTTDPADESCVNLGGDKAGEIGEIAGIPLASHLNIVRTEDEKSAVVIAVGAGPVGQVSKKKLKEGDVLVLLRTGETGAHALRVMQRVVHVQKLARPMIALLPVGEGGVVCTAISLGKGISLDVELAQKEGFLSEALAEAVDGTYLAVVRGGELTEWLADVAEAGLTVCTLGEIKDSSDIIVTCGEQELVSIDTSFVAHLASKGKVYMALEDEKNAKLNAVDALTRVYTEKGDYVNGAKAELTRLAVCSKRGLTACLDGFGGEQAHNLAFGGKNGQTPALGEVVSLHTVENTVCAVTCSDYGSLTQKSPFVSSVNAVASAVTKQLVMGTKLSDIRVYTPLLTNEETHPNAMGEKFASAIGSVYALNALGIPSHGEPVVAKSSEGTRAMAFAVGTVCASDLRSNVFTKEGRVYRIALPRGESGVPDFEHIKKLAHAIEEAKAHDAEFTATVLDEGDSAVTAIIKSCLGSGMGFYFYKPTEKLFEQTAGDVLVTCSDIKHFAGLGVEYVGEVQTGVSFEFGTKVLNTFGVTQNYTSHFERKFPTVASNARGMVENYRFRTAKEMKCLTPVRPRIFLPILKGTNNEYTLTKCFRDFGAIPVPVVLTGAHDDTMIEAVCEAIAKSQIIALTDGCISEEERARFVKLMTNERVRAEVNGLMNEREGLAIGTGAGFDLLNRLGLLACDEINPKKKDFELEKGNLGRKIWTTAKVKVVSTLSPWLYAVDPGEVYGVRLNTAEGRVVLSDEKKEEFVRTGRIATQFVDSEGFATMESPYNVTGSDLAIEGVFSPSGRVYGRCGANERADANYVGTETAWDMKVFESGVKYFK